MMTAPRSASSRQTLIVTPLVLAFFVDLTGWNSFARVRPSSGSRTTPELLRQPARTSAPPTFTLQSSPSVGTARCNALGLGLRRADRATAPASNAVIRTILFYPHIISALIIGFLWSALLSNSGVINELLSQLGASPLPFLSDPTWAGASVILVTIWATFGVNLVLYIAGLQAIPADYYEAAELDGASPWQQFRHVTFPMMAPVVTVNLVITMVWMLKAYDLVLSLTAGGPAGRTQTAVYQILVDSIPERQARLRRRPSRGPHARRRRSSGVSRRPGTPPRRAGKAPH